MKISLVLCPALFKRSPLIGLAYLSSYLKYKGYDLKIIDLNSEITLSLFDYNERDWQNKVFLNKFISEHNDLMESSLEKILQSKAEVIGFSTWATTRYLSFQLAKMIKERDKDRLIVFGGPECSFSGGEIIKNEAVDLVVIGEGEETLAKILNLYEKKGKIDYCLGTYLKRDDNIVNCGFSPEIENLDGLPFPDYSDFEFNNYASPYSLPISFYRGCIRHCVFCNTSVTWKKFRSRTAKNIFDEMIYQIAKYPQLQKFDIDDTAINLNLPMLSELCDLIIANGLKINWGGSGLIRKEMDSVLITKMAKAGCNCIGYGLESGSQKIINHMGKGFNIEDAERVIHDTYNAGIETILGIIIGFPTETEEDFRKTLDFIKRNKDYLSWIDSPSECCIGCNNYIHRFPERFDVILDGEHWYSKDENNTHEVRQERIRRFNEFCATEGIRIGNYITVHNSKQL